jgi:hypothetical protein
LIAYSPSLGNFQLALLRPSGIDPLTAYGEMEPMAYYGL